jgi:hypothetical protein
MSYDWDQHKQTGDWITFDSVGDQIIGEIIAIRTGKDFNQNPCPELVIRTDDGDEKTLTAGQVRLKSELAAQAPQVGDRIRIVYSGVGESKPGKAPAKLFDVAVRAKDPNATPVPVAAAPAPVPADEVPF